MAETEVTIDDQLQTEQLPMYTFQMNDAVKKMYMLAVRGL